MRANEREILIKPSGSTPLLSFDPENTRILISGTSFAENPFLLFSPVNELVEQYLIFGYDHLHLEVRLTYFNSSTSKALFFLLKRISRLVHKIEVKIDWYLVEQDDDLEEIVSDYSSELDLDINLIR